MSSSVTGAPSGTRRTPETAAMEPPSAVTMAPPSAGRSYAARIESTIVWMLLPSSSGTGPPARRTPPPTERPPAVQEARTTAGGTSRSSPRRAAPSAGPEQRLDEPRQHLAAAPLHLHRSSVVRAGGADVDDRDRHAVLLRPEHEAPAGVDRERRAHDQQHVALLEQTPRLVHPLARHVLAEEDDVGLHDPATRLAAGHPEPLERPRGQLHIAVGLDLQRAALRRSREPRRPLRIQLLEPALVRLAR